MIQNLLALVADAISASCKTKVANFNRAVLIDKHVGWFEVTVQNFAFVDVLDCMQQVPDYGFNVSLL